MSLLCLDHPSPHLDSCLNALVSTDDAPRQFLARSSFLLAACNRSVLIQQEPLVLLLDGRIDNSHELADQLGLTRDTSSQKVLLHAYQCWGKLFAERLTGDFAFLLWDGSRRHLLLARDPAGSRPLFYALHKGAFYASSEPRGLAPAIPLRVSEAYVAHWLTGTLDTADLTPFEGLRRVVPGNTVVFAEGKLSIHDSWRPHRIRPLRLRDPREYAEGLRSHLEQAILACTPPSGPVGSQLSGGLDSSSVTAVAASCFAGRGRSLTAFTAVPETTVTEPFFAHYLTDESRLAAATASHFPAITHTLIPNNAHPLIATIDRFNRASGQPVYATANVPWLYEILLRCRNLGISTLLTGYKGNFTISYDGQLALLRSLTGLRFSAAWQLARRMRTQGASWKSIGGFALGPDGRALLQVVRRTDQASIMDSVAIQPGFATRFGIQPRHYFACFHSPFGIAYRTEGLRAHDMGMSLIAGERLTGVVSTDPTAARNVLDFCLSIPEEIFRDGMTGRSLVRSAMRGYVPDEVLDASSRGFQAAGQFQQIHQERREITQTVRAMRQHPLLAQALNLAFLERLVEDWPETAPTYSAWKNYAHALMRSVSLARFIFQTEEGSLWKRDEKLVLPH